MFFCGDFSILGQEESPSFDGGAIPSAQSVLTADTTNGVNVISQPANDAFDRSAKLSGTALLINSSNVNATLETDEPSLPGFISATNSVWWSWSIPQATNVLIDASGSDFGLVLAVYTGSTLTNLQLICLAINDLYKGKGAYATFQSSPGMTYRIAVYGRDSSQSGSIRLRLVTGMDPDTTPPSICVLMPEDSARFTNNPVSFNGTAQDEINGSGIAAVYLFVNDELYPVLMEGRETWSGSVSLLPGTNQIRACGVDFAGNVGGWQTLQLRLADPSNDFFDEAAELQGAKGTMTGNSQYASKEIDEPFLTGNEGGRSVWYFWRAQADGYFYLSTSNSSFDTMLGLYEGDRVDSLYLDADNDDAIAGSQYSELVYYVRSNRVYHIAVDGYGGVGGPYVLSYRLDPGIKDGECQLLVDSDIGGSTRPSGGDLSNKHLGGFDGRA